MVGANAPVAIFRVWGGAWGGASRMGIVRLELTLRLQE